MWLGFSPFRFQFPCPNDISETVVELFLSIQLKRSTEIQIFGNGSGCDRAADVTRRGGGGRLPRGLQ